MKNNDTNVANAQHLQNVKIRDFQKKRNSGLVNYIASHVQSPDDEHKRAIREISTRHIQKLSYCDQ